MPLFDPTSFQQNYISMQLCLTSFKKEQNLYVFPDYFQYVVRYDEYGIDSDTFTFPSDCGNIGCMWR